MRLHNHNGEDSTELWTTLIYNMSSFSHGKRNRKITIKTLKMLAEQVLIAFYKKLRSDYTHADRWRLLERLAKDRVKMHLLEQRFASKELERMFKEHPPALRIALARMSFDVDRFNLDDWLSNLSQEDLRFCAEEYMLDYVEHMVQDGNIEISFLMKFRPDGAALEEVSIEHQLDKVPDPIGKTGFMPEKEIMRGTD